MTAPELVAFHGSAETCPAPEQLGVDGAGWPVVGCPGHVRGDHVAAPVTGCPFCVVSEPASARDIELRARLALETLTRVALAKEAECEQMAKRVQRLEDGLTRIVTGTEYRGWRWAMEEAERALAGE